MRKKQFKAESKKLLDMMINSIYTNKEIFLRELISNASDAIDKQYFHSLSSDGTGLGREDYVIKVTLDKENRILTVEDNGCGIAADDLPHIKEKFFKANLSVKGSGIGLAVCDEIVRLHKGTLDITSTEGVGTTVTVTLPLANQNEV